MKGLTLGLTIAAAVIIVVGVGLGIFFSVFFQNMKSIWDLDEGKTKYLLLT